MEISRYAQSYREFLLEEMTDRKSKNPAYSLRAFARDLNISPAVCSQVLSGKRHLSRKNLGKIADALGLSPAQVSSIRKEITGVSLDRTEYLEVQEDVFRVMSDWYYFAILNLARLKDNKAQPTWVAKRLGLSLAEAKVAISRLKRLGYLAIENGRLKRTAVSLITTEDVPSSALRQFHKQNLALAVRALDDVPVNQREITTITMPADLSRLPGAKKLIREFRSKLANHLSAGKPTEVYTMAIQLFPISKPRGNHDKNA